MDSLFKQSEVVGLSDPVSLLVKTNVRKVTVMFTVGFLLWTFVTSNLNPFSSFLLLIGQNFIILKTNIRGLCWCLWFVQRRRICKEE